MVGNSFENDYIPPGGLFAKSLKGLPFDLPTLFFGQKDPHPIHFRGATPRKVLNTSQSMGNCLLNQAFGISTQIGFIRFCRCKDVSCSF